MEDSNNQDAMMEINNDNNTNEIEEEEEDDDDDTEDCRYDLDKNTFEELKKNNPAITNLRIWLNCDDTEHVTYFFNKIDWKVDGDCIAKNTHIKRLRISYQGSCLGRPFGQPYILGEEGHNLPTRQQLQDFFSCIYQSHSIKDIDISNMDISDDFGGGLIEGLQGHPSLERLEISGGRAESIVCEAIGKVLKHPQSKLKDLRFDYCKLDDNGLVALCDGLVGNSTLKRLCLDGNRDMTSVGWQALSTVLQSPNCQIVYLQLKSTCLNDERANILGSVLHGSPVKALDVSYNGSINSISREGWQTFINHLSQTAIKNLDLSNNKINDAGLAALASIGTIKSLELSSNDLITSDGWRSFFNTLQMNRTQLVKLDISGNNIGNGSVAALGSLLGSMSSLKTLEMTGTLGDVPNGITPHGWVSLFTTLQDSNLDLIELNLGSNSIDDQGIQLLVPLVSRMISLKRLGLNCNQRATPTGWRALSAFLQSPNFVLEELELASNKINDDTMVTFANALTHNETLKFLDLFECHDENGDDLITNRGWEAVSSLLCNKTSIMNTYTSNHTLQEDFVDDYIENVDSYLDLNKNKDKAEVARQKILQTHFSGSGATSKMQELLAMELEMMPTVIAWIGRPTHAIWSGENVSGLSTMFNLMQRVPDLFDSSSQKPSAAN